MDGQEAQFESPPFPNGHEITPVVTIGQDALSLQCQCGWNLDVDSACLSGEELPGGIYVIEGAIRRHWGYVEPLLPEALGDGESPVHYVRRVFGWEPMWSDARMFWDHFLREEQVARVMARVGFAGARFMDLFPDAQTFGEAVEALRKRSN